MALIWIATTGNSDVKLTSDDGWRHLRTESNKQLKPCHKKEFSPLIKGNDNLLSLPARVIGIVYGDAWNTHQKYFKFPLLEEFTRKLKSENKNPDRIIVLLTNQEKVFVEDSDRAEDSPYWRDTSRLEPILKHYFDREFGENKVEFIPLEPKTREEGLDNWDSTLELVETELLIKFKELEISKNDSLIVSHQASTPAISSAVQFVSLANFGERVDFLISNERDPELTRFLEGSKYLKGIRKREAETLLERHDYSGIEVLIKDYIKNDNDTKILLDAAIQWNFANFGTKHNQAKHQDECESFIDSIEKLSNSKFQVLIQVAKERSQQWWWIAYEEVYLAEIRRLQGNIVEAFFHSFRAFEYIFASWGKQYFDDHVEIIEGVPCLKTSALDDAKEYFSKKKCNDVSGLDKIKEKLEFLKKKEGSEENIKSHERVKLDMHTLCKFFRSSRYKEYKKNCGELKIFWDTQNNKENNVSEKRNFIVHQAQGMIENNLYDFWGIEKSDDITKRQSAWMIQFLKFLNFITQEDLEKKGLLVEFESFKSLKEASLMKQVHQELEKAIANL